jgi:hypothetical protein
MNVKSGCEKAEVGRQRDAALRRQTHMNMSNTPFTNIETCNGACEAADDKSSRAFETLLPFLRFWLYSYLGLAPAAYCPFQSYLRFWRI